LLNIHLKNIAMVVKHRESMWSSNSFLWGLLIRNKRSDILAPVTKAIVLSWWAFETHMSPNHKDVVRRKLTLHSHQVKPIQYLMEMHVSLFIILCFLFISLCPLLQLHSGLVFFSLGFMMSFFWIILSVHKKLWMFSWILFF
jgi:hypothetical protein